MQAAPSSSSRHSTGGIGQDSTIVGIVTDPAGAVVPNVPATIPHVETGKVRIVTASDSGQYAATALDQGDVGNGGISNSVSFLAPVGGQAPALAPNQNTGAITSAFDPRTIQLGLKLVF